MVDMPALRSLMDRQMTKLGPEFKPLNYNDLERRAGRSGIGETFRRLHKGQHSGEVRDSTIEALARALEVPYREVLEAIEGEGAPEPFELPRRAARLSQEERRVVLSVVDSILRAAERGRVAGSGREATVTPIRGEDERRVAQKRRPSRGAPPLDSP